MNAWIAIVLAGIGSFACRVGVTLVLERRSLPSWFEAGSRYVMPATFAGLVAPALLRPIAGGSSTAVPVSAAALVTVLVALRRSAQTAVLTGMASLWIAHALVVAAT